MSFYLELFTLIHTFAIVNKKHKIMKNIHFILAALLLLGITGCSSTGKNKEANDSTQVAAIAEDTAAAEAAAPAELSEAAQQEIQAKKSNLKMCAPILLILI